MICKKSVKQFCSEDISLIENYQEAINDTTQTWHCHHRLETDLGLSAQELKDTGRYYKVEAKYLIFLTHSEHRTLHNSVNFIGKNNPFYGKHHTEESKQGNREKHLGKTYIRTEEQKQHMRKQKPKHKWMTPDGNIVEMVKNCAERHHPDWKLIE